MATGTNGIATRGDCNNIIKYSFSGDLTKCPTKSEINATRGLVVDSEVGYESNQLVKYVDIDSTKFTVNLVLTTSITGGASLNKIEFYYKNSSGTRTSSGSYTRSSDIPTGSETKASCSLFCPEGSSTYTLSVYVGKFGSNREIRYKDDYSQTT